MYQKMIWLLIVLILVAGGLLYLRVIPTPLASLDEQGEGFQISSVHGAILIMDFPQANEKITSPLIVRGKARGTWFFEATLPIALIEQDGGIIAESYVQAQEEWMTEDYVPFEGKLIFDKSVYGGNGFLVLHKDNPSGLPENDDMVKIPVKF